QAARSAANVGAFESRFKTDLHQLLLDEAVGDDGAKTMVDPELRIVAEEREQVVEDATNDNRDMSLSNLGDDSRLGQAMLGAKGSGELNENRFATLRSQADIAQMRHASWHEFGHTLQVPVSLRANEGHAELFANQRTGNGLSHVRSGQPDVVYGEGQRMMKEASDKFGWGSVDAMMQGREDRGKLLTWLAEIDPELGGQDTVNPENN
ncbi:MAG: hypothetical protein QF741_02620, partial [Candidatus Peribacteraceae bacterium]|nr:hypothetical protein [Candidatus Peribacteraceae bacterium]